MKAVEKPLRIISHWVRKIMRGALFGWN